MYMNSNWVDAKETSKEKWEASLRGKGGEIEAQIPSQNLKVY